MWPKLLPTLPAERAENLAALAGVEFKPQLRKGSAALLPAQVREGSPRIFALFSGLVDEAIDNFESKLCRRTTDDYFLLPSSRASDGALLSPAVTWSVFSPMQHTVVMILWTTIIIDSGLHNVR